MGQTKQWMFEQESSSDLVDFLEQLIAIDEIKDSVVLGIAKQVIDKGASSMSEKQEFRMNSFVNEFKEQNHCERCVDGNIGSLTDYIFIYESSNSLCPSCQYDYEKAMAD